MQTFQYKRSCFLGIVKWKGFRERGGRLFKPSVTFNKLDCIHKKNRCDAWLSHFGSTDWSHTKRNIWETAGDSEDSGPTAENTCTGFHLQKNNDEITLALFCILNWCFVDHLKNRKKKNQHLYSVHMQVLYRVKWFVLNT